MEIDSNKHNHKQTGQGEVSQANTSESISNSLPPPDLSHLIKHLKKLKNYYDNKLKNLNMLNDSAIYHYCLGKLEVIDYVLDYLTSLGVED